MGRVAPDLLECVVASHYAEITQYPGPAERIRFCNLFATQLDLDKDAARYVRLCTTINRVALLPLAEQAGSTLLNVLEALKPQARLTAAQFMQRMPSKAMPGFVSDLLRSVQSWSGWPDADQVKLIQASQHQPLGSILESWNEYGTPALEEIAKNGKIGFLFKLTHSKRR